MASKYTGKAKDDSYFVWKAVEHIDAIIEYVGEKSYDDFVSDDLLIGAVMFRLIQMAENLSRLTDEFKEGHPEIQTGYIIGFRNGIVHNYGKTDYRIVFDIVSNDILRLKRELLFSNSSTEGTKKAA